ncbi:MAG TPA: ribosomal-processing cysteine protease Prp [Clostridiaceae bacterium]|jgi:uncharacterized protein YsxB (DUF464 family)|nr:ribosomal-processing cysteine protease Prp [Clostridiaceae bacterium]
MIRVSIKRDKTGLVREFTIRGHSGFDEPGRDIICSAVSAIAYTALGGLQELAGVVNHKERAGYMKFQLPLLDNEEVERTARIILDTMVIGLRQIENTYGSYIKVVDEEV